MRLNSSNTGTWWPNGAVLLIALTLVSACSRQAVQSPDENGSVTAAKPEITEFPRDDQTLTCAEVAAQTIKLEGQNRRAEVAINGGRPQRQTAEYIAELFLVSIAEADTKEEQVALLSKNQRRQDDLRRLQRAKGC